MVAQIAARKPVMAKKLSHGRLGRINSTVRRLGMAEGSCSGSPSNRPGPPRSATIWWGFRLCWWKMAMAMKSLPQRRRRTRTDLSSSSCGRKRSIEKPRIQPAGLQVECGGIPHLAKNERDIGHPGF